MLLRDQEQIPLPLGTERKIKKPGFKQVTIHFFNCFKVKQSIPQIPSQKNVFLFTSVSCTNIICKYFILVFDDNSPAYHQLNHGGGET